jgi:hypothetical protein
MSNKGDGTDFHLFDSSGVGLIGISEDRVIRHTNSSLSYYLDAKPDDILGQEVSVLGQSLVSEDFWSGFATDKPFYCLLPGSQHLLLTHCLNYAGPSEETVRKVILLRPYGLEREFIRMRSRLNQNVVLEISSHLSSVAIAGEIILQPELQENETTRGRFLSTFFRDITDLSELFTELQEIAEPIPFPNRVRPAALDWKGLVTDLLIKMRGLANERNVSVENGLPGHVSPVQGNYHWLYLALYEVLNQAVAEAPTLGEIQVSCAENNGTVATKIEYLLEESPAEPSWPPQTLFELPEDDPRIGKMALSEMALSRSIFLLHKGDLEKTENRGKVTFTARLPV